MRINSIRAENFRPFKHLEEIKLGSLATIVGQNDVGKSNILRALQLFFVDSKPKIDESDIYDGAEKNEDIIIEVSFNSLPEKIELEPTIETTFKDEKLLDKNNCLRIRKIYPHNELTNYKVSLITHDFDDDRFFGLSALNEQNLNEQCQLLEIDYQKSGRGITNKSKREKLRTKAKEMDIQLKEKELPLDRSKDVLWKKTIYPLLPNFELFETDTKLGVGETTFQNKFKPILDNIIVKDKVVNALDALKEETEEALQTEIDKIFKHLKKYTDAFTGLTAKPNFALDKAFNFDILGKDKFDIENSLDQRGSGMRRLLMVAYFQYLAEKKIEEDTNYIFAVEEPENCLHPGLQRELASSFRKLADEGYQIIVTSHSPVFAGSSPKEDLALVIREAGIAKAIQHPELKLHDVAMELGVEPSDQIFGYNACIFVEGISDIEFFTAIASKLKKENHIDVNFDDVNIGLLPCGGENLKHWVNMNAMKRINRNFAVIVDSDKKSPTDNIPQRKKNWEISCKNEGGKFIILKKREIENYIHPESIKRSQNYSYEQYDSYTDMKTKFGSNVYKLIHDMSCDEILEMDCYEENGKECHELEEKYQRITIFS